MAIIIIVLSCLSFVLSLELQVQRGACGSPESDSSDSETGI